MAERLEFVKIEVKDFINQYFYRYKILENEFEKFKESLINYIGTLEKHKNQNEDFLVANCLSPFFNNINFETQIKSKMKGKSEIDLSIVKDSNIQIIIEAKKPNDKDSFGYNNPNCKALHEAILYYFRIREESNFSIKYIILTDFYKFYIFEAKEFERVFYRNKDFEMMYKSFKNKNSMFNGKTEEFYLEAKNILERKNFNLKGTFVDLSDILNILQNDKNCKNNFKDLKPYFKIFSRDFLLQEFNPNDANELNKGFYDELLHILGLSEKIINNKTIIVPSKNSINREGTLYYNILQRLPEDKRDEKENEINEKVLEILIIWINRILFLKLLESSLINFNNDKNLGFLNIEKIKDYNKLNYLFFNILAKNKEDRNGQTAEDLEYLPYLNSSLFTRSEKEIIDISQLSNLKLEYFKNTQIKDGGGHSKKGKEDWLKMIFEFLNSFDFGARDDNENILAQKDLINSSVLGLVFEKLNGYKEGSFYTPSFITSYMCKESLEKIVLQKFRENGLNADNLDILQKQILANMNADFNFRDKAINILEEIRICDPAVGSGHFLVSALNETVYIYYKLGLLNIPISDLKIENDEILIKDLQGKNFEYFRPRFENDNHKIQRELFNLKKSIIENNLFGVDINNNSCEITKLRLWIELLKNSYYLSFDNGNYHNLQTLPNIDINIKCGNSLISNIDFGISKDNFLSNLKSRINEADMFERETLKKELDDITKELPQIFENAKVQAKIYKNSSDKTEAKKSKAIYEESILYLIKLFKRTCNEYINFYSDLHDFFYTYGYININNISDEQIKSKLKYYIEYFNFYEFVDFEKKIIREVKEKELSKTKSLMQAYEDFESKKTFEWRFEFPEVLDYEGNFTGFDLVIGNPPYVLVLKEHENYYQYKIKYKTANGGKINLYNLFFEQSLNLIRENYFLGFITPNTYLTSPNTEVLRNILLSQTSIYEITEYTEKQRVFEKAAQAVATIILTTRKMPNHKIIITTSKQGGKLCLQEDLKNRKLLLWVSPLILKIEKQKYRLKDFFGIFQGEVNLTIKKEYYSDKKYKDYLPMWRGDNVGKYYPQSKPKEWCNKLASNNHFRERRIILQQVSNQGQKFRTKAFISDKDFICGNSTNYLISKNNENLLLFLGIINSKVFNFYFNYFSFTNHLTVKELENIPIPEINSKNKDLEDKIINKVDEILKIKNKNSNADVSEIEREIDKIVYELYWLSEEEVKIIENK